MPAYDTHGDVAVVLGGPDAFCAARAAFEELTAALGGVEAGSWSHDRLEGYLEAHGREVLRLLLQDHLALRALREQQAAAQQRGIPLTDADGVSHRTVEPGHVRQLTTVFGTVQVRRCAWRATGARNLYPADAALNLPERLHSYGLHKRAVVEAVRGSFDGAHQAITHACGNVAGRRQLQQLTI